MEAKEEMEREGGEGAGSCDFFFSPAQLPEGGKRGLPLTYWGPIARLAHEMHLHKLGSRNHQGERPSPAWNLSSQPRAWRIFQT